MTDLFLSSSYFAVTLTLLAYAFGCLCQRTFKLSVFNPILIGALTVMGVLYFLEVPNSVYQRGCQILSYLLTPATICLSISFYSQYQKLKHHLGAIFAGVLTGCISCLGSIWLLANYFGLNHQLTVSLLPKSITTAIGVVMSEALGGIGAITTAAIILTGILGNVFGPFLCKILAIRDPIAKGVAFGTGSHVIGTSRAVQVGELVGAVSSLSLTLAGLITAVLLSFCAQYI